MMGYKTANLRDLVREIGEEETKKLLSDFCCPLNRDVEKFLREKAIEFSRQEISATHLVFASFQGKLVLVGYFTLANKSFVINKASTLSKTLKKRCAKFMTYDPELRRYSCNAPLIAQLGKNFYKGYDRLITGAELLKIACEKVRMVQYDLGGKIAYLECEDKPKLIDFYSAYGFVEFDKRSLERDEQGDMDGKHLVQMMIYF